MKDLIEIILKGLAQFVPVMAAVVASPKKNILAQLQAQTDRLNRAMTFCGIAIAIGFAFQAPLVPADRDFVTIAGSLLAFKIISILTFVGFITLGFRWLGGRGSYESTLCAYLYIISPVYLFLVVTHSINIGVLTSYDQQLADIWRSGQLLSETQINDFFNQAPLKAASVTLLWLVQIVFSFVWFLICWGVYRSLHQVSRIRSAMVFLVTTAIWYVYTFLSIIIMKGLHGGILSPIG